MERQWTSLNDFPATFVLIEKNARGSWSSMRGNRAFSTALLTYFVAKGLTVLEYRDGDFYAW